MRRFFKSFHRLAGAFSSGLMILASNAPAAPADAGGVEFFESRVRPLLAEKCYSCHSARSGKLKGGLRLDWAGGTLRGGDTGPALVPGDPEKSLLVKAIRHTDPDLQMPPKKRLSPEEVGDLIQWIKLGAPDPRTDPPTVTHATVAAYNYPLLRKSWAFRSPVEPAVPAIRRPKRAQSPIDNFIFANLDEKQVPPAPPAGKAALIRRATFDLTGLPPTPEEIDAFARDRSPGAFARVVDRLLASPRYGERWARHWLDVARYADSVDARQIGRPGDIEQSYRYRDWVVNAFNRDLPFDQFVVMQIAGDLLPPPEPGGLNTEGIVATTFLAIGRWEQGEADKEKMLTDVVDDQVDMVSRGFLGLTVACARCHDHKFDPVPTEDYYSLAGIFFSSHVLPEPGAKGGDSERLRIPLLRPAELARRHEEEKRAAAIEAELKAASAKPGTTASTNVAPPPAPEHLADLKRELEGLKKRLEVPVPSAHGIQEGGVPQSVWAGIADAPILIRGRYDRRGSIVPRRFPRILAGDNQPAIAGGSGRLDLARWMASPANPLTARVMVNRVWQDHFGEGLVRTPNNFGKLGDPPVLPELLDYLAVSFVKSGWSIKALHRAIMLSSAYQRSSEGPAELTAADPENRWFGRMNRRRLDAEALRDSLLALAGRLDPAMGGPAVNDMASPRRTLYLMAVRSDRSNYRMLFDAADPTAIVEKRLDSTVAPQALFLMNNSFVLNLARDLAGRVPALLGSDKEKIQWLYRRIYGRRPEPGEIRIGEGLLRRARESMDGGRAWQQYCQMLLCANEFIYVD